MTPLREIRAIQPDAGFQRRWFSGHQCNLFVWEDAARAIAAFQFCYETHDGEEAVEWRRDSGVRHAHVVDTSVAMKDRTPGLQFDTHDANAAALNVFNSCSGRLEARIVDFIRECLQGLPESERVETTVEVAPAASPPREEVDDLRKLGGRLI